MSAIIVEVEHLIDCTRNSLRFPPRNAYEAENTHIANMERLRAARALLTNFSGPNAERLLAELDALEWEANTVRFKQTSGAEALLNVDFGGDDDDDKDEVTAVEQELAQREKKKKNAEDRKAKAKTKEKTERRARRDPEPPAPLSREKTPPAEPADIPCSAPVSLLARFTNCGGDEIPLSAIGPGRCAAVPGTPLACLQFDAAVEYDGQTCECRVTLFRAVVVALACGVPPSAEQIPPPPLPSSPLPSSPLPSSHAPQVLGEELGGAASDSECESVGSSESVTAELSRQLVAEYALQEEREGEEEGARVLPHDIPLSLRSSLRAFSALPWVVLMCHGGYFAGGVFVGGEPVVHKAFQRYVVRKKQGGKQSSSEKDSGSYNSAGSLIRRAQEIKWKMDVRETLHKWRAYIDAAAVVLYVAPGPQNRAVLTDFTGLPAAAGCDDRVQSPIDLKDPRVRKAPLTTHKPTFQEVQRIYSTVATCTVEYVLR